jgi:2-polyprenyl-3-methyl-5-hydroxy-6-metoxy-1,4-benzoquinol methylase
MTRRMEPSDKKLQNEFSSLYPDDAYNFEKRKQKARKIISILDDYFSGKLEMLTALDVGCSVGVISNELSKSMGKVIGVDIDRDAIELAKKRYHSHNVDFLVQNSLDLEFSDNSFDIVICNHIYEHVPDPGKLTHEIHRVLKQGGVCYFAAGNRITLIEPHYRLPLLSVFPKPIANFYLSLFRKGKSYYENLMTYWKLRDLVARFTTIDYTVKIIESPQKYQANDMVKENSLKQKMARWIIKRAYWLSPTYIWLLRKDLEH